MVRQIFLTLLLSLTVFATHAQDDALPVITADNIRDLAPARTVRFDEMEPFTLDTSGMPLSGWFTLTPDGTWLAFVIDGGVRLIPTVEGLSGPHGLSRPDGIHQAGSTVIDARWDDASERIGFIYEYEGEYFLRLTQDLGVTQIPIPLAGVPVRFWFDSEDSMYFWIESTPAPEDPDRSGFQVSRLMIAGTQPDLLTLPTGPEHDFDSFVRIGRIPAPLAITATFAGTVRRWNLETGEVTAEVEMPVAPTFGRVNETNGVHFAWRDETSTALHLLNFETGEDREIAPLDGEYIQALIPSPDASVILAVHRGETPDVTAWIVETGEEIALGEYDTTICSRVPDMVQLARNGTRLVIGCEDGFQVWEVK